MNRPPSVTLESLRRQPEHDGQADDTERAEWNATMERMVDPFMGARYVLHNGRRHWVTAGQMQRIRSASLRAVVL